MPTLLLIFSLLIFPFSNSIAADLSVKNKLPANFKNSNVYTYNIVSSSNQKDGSRIYEVSIQKNKNEIRSISCNANEETPPCQIIPLSNHQFILLDYAHENGVSTIPEFHLFNSDGVKDSNFQTVFDNPKKTNARIENLDVVEESKTTKGMLRVVGDFAYEAFDGIKPYQRHFQIDPYEEFDGYKSKVELLLNLKGEIIKTNVLAKGLIPYTPKQIRKELNRKIAELERKIEEETKNPMGTQNDEIRRYKQEIADYQEWLGHLSKQ